MAACELVHRPTTPPAPLVVARCRAKLKKARREVNVRMKVGEEHESSTKLTLQEKARVLKEELVKEALSAVSAAERLAERVQKTIGFMDIRAHALLRCLFNAASPITL